MRIVALIVLLLLSLSGFTRASAAEQEVTPTWVNNELYCLARAIYGEARGESKEAQYAVGFSVINRAHTNRRDFGGGDICSVVFYGNQYSSVKGELNDKWQPKDWDAWFASLMSAWRVLTKRVVPQGAMRKALYYLNPHSASKAGKRWFQKHLRAVGQSGHHVFYTERAHIMLMAQR